MSTIFFFLAVSTLLIYSCQIAMIVFYFKKPLVIKSNPVKHQVFISVIIPVRNEESNIGKLLNYLNNQSYNKSLFEVILVDDHSEDKTMELINEYLIHHPEMSILTGSLSDHFSKKMAITAGINMSMGELIVTTDGDCQVPPDWLLKLAAYYDQYQPQMIIGPVSLSGSESFFDSCHHC